MSRKVFVSSDISHDEALIEVAGVEPTAALLWPWLLTAFDDWGRARADARRLKAEIWPMIDAVTVPIIDKALGLYHDNKLLELYEIGGIRYMQIPEQKWRRFQTHIRWDRKAGQATSTIPASTRHLPGTFPADDGQLRETPGYSTPSPSPSPSVSTSQVNRGTTPREAADLWKNITNSPSIGIRAIERFLTEHPDLTQDQLKNFLTWAHLNGCKTTGGWTSWYPAWPKQSQKTQLEHCDICNDRRLVGVLPNGQTTTVDDLEATAMTPCTCTKVS